MGIKNMMTTIQHLFFQGFFDQYTYDGGRYHGNQRQARLLQQFLPCLAPRESGNYKSYQYILTIVSYLMSEHPSGFESKEDCIIKENCQNLFEEQLQQQNIKFPKPPSPKREHPTTTKTCIQPQHIKPKPQQFLPETSHSATTTNQPQGQTVTYPPIKILRPQKKSKPPVRLELDMTHQKFERRTKQISLADLKNELKYFLDMNQQEWSRKIYWYSQEMYHDIAQTVFISRIHHNFVTDIVHEERPEIDYHCTRAIKFKQILKQSFELVWSSLKTTGKPSQQVLMITGWGKHSEGESKLGKILWKKCVAMKKKKLLSFIQAPDTGSILVTFYRC